MHKYDKSLLVIFDKKNDSERFEFTYIIIEESKFTDMPLATTIK